MAGISVTSFDGHALNSSTYQTGLELENGNPFIREADVVQHQVPGKYGRHVRSDPRPASMALHVTIVGTTSLQTRQDELMGWFEPGTVGLLVVDFDGVSRTVEAAVSRLVPSYRGPTSLLVIFAVADPRWYSTAAKTDSRSITSTPTAFVLTNDGQSNEDGLIMDVSVDANKAAANSWPYAREIILANRVPRALLNWAYDVTNGGIDHATLVSGGKSQADGDDVRVLVDGIQVDRWDGEAAATDFNSATTKVWINLTLSPGLSAELATAMTAGAPANGGQIDVESGGTAGWPEKGYLIVDNELVRYDGRTESAFLNVTRAQRGTTAASHSVGAAIAWVERRVQLIYGHTGITAPVANDHKKPMLNLGHADLTNLVHVWTNGYSHATDPRSMQWVYDFEQSDLRADRWVADRGGSGTAMQLEFSPDTEQQDAFLPVANRWLFRSPIPVGQFNYNVTLEDQDFAVESFLISEQGGFAIVNQHFSPAVAENGDFAIEGSIAVGFRARQQTVVRPPDQQIDDDDTFTTVKQRQAFVVPDARDGVRKIERVFLRLSATSSSEATVTLAIEDPATPGSFLVISDGVAVGSISTEAWVEFAFAAADQPVVQPGQTVYIEVVRTSGTGTFTWHGGVGEYEGVGNYREFRVCSLHFEPNDETFGVPDSGGAAEVEVLNDLILDYQSAKVPYHQMLAEAAIYWHAWTITNTTTSQAITANLFLALTSVLRIDVGARRVYDIASGEELIFGVTFTDEDQWISLVPGGNSIQYAETGVVDVDVDSTWHDRWT